MPGGQVFSRCMERRCAAVGDAAQGVLLPLAPSGPASRGSAGRGPRGPGSVAWALDQSGVTPGCVEEVLARGLGHWTILQTIASEPDPVEELDLFWSAGERRGSPGPGVEAEAREAILALMRVAEPRARVERRAMAVVARGPRPLAALSAADPAVLPDTGGIQVKRARLCSRRSGKQEPGHEKLQREDCERKKWIAVITGFLAAAPDDAVLVRDARAARRPCQALEGLWGKRRSRTLRAIAKTLGSLEAWMGDRSKIFELTEVQLVDYLADRADEPCGKTVPEKVIAHVHLFFERTGLPTPVGRLAKGQAALLHKQLAATEPREIKKALQPLLLVVAAMEVAVADRANNFMGVEGRVVLGVELTKIYLSARWDDIEGLDARNMKLTNDYWGGERCFISTKMSGPGCHAEVLPAWVSRRSFSGRDWVGPFKELLDMDFGGKHGALARCPWTGGRMDYVRKMRLTRTVLMELDLREIMTILGLPTEETKVTLPPEFCMLHTEHGARAFFTTIGRQAGVPAQQLNCLGR